MDGTGMLKDRVAAISGAAGGLGPVVARAFLDAGATLAVSGRSADRLAELIDSLPGSSGRVHPAAVDLTDEEAARRWAGDITGKLGRVDIVVHLVGGYRGGSSIGQIAAADWEFLHDGLVRTTLNVVRAFVGPLTAHGWGRFLGVTSPRAQAPTGKSALYAMAKAASDALVLALANEVSGSGATANLIMVDSIATDGEVGTGAAKKPYGKSTPAREIAAAMLFLCSEEAAVINGVRLPLIGRG